MANTVLRRMRAAASFDSSVFDELRRDRAATWQAALVVVLAGISQGVVGVGLGWGRALESAVTLPAGWIVWAGMTLLVGTRIFGSGAEWAELLRLLGFAHAPWTLAFLGLVPGVGWLVSAVLLIWTLAAGRAALQSVLGLDAARTLTTVVVGWAAVLSIQILF